MNVPHDPSVAAPDLQVQVVHDFAARPEAVFDAWLDATTVGQWLFATPGGQMKRVEVDARVGGGFEIAEQRGDSLAEHTATYVALERPGHIAFEFAAQRGIPTTLVDIVIEPTAEVARLTLTQAMDPAWAAFVSKSREGWAAILDGLDSLLAADRTVVSQREIAAPP